MVDTTGETRRVQEEQSNLKFNHKVHLKPEGISTPDGDQVLQCDYMSSAG